MDESRLQEYLNRNDILIEGNTASWEVRLDGDIQGTYTGTFKFRCYLTPTQRLAASREHRELVGPHASLAPTHDDNLAFSLSQLKYRVLSAPPFWASNGISGDIPDSNVIDAVLEAAIAAELKYKAQLKQKKNDAIQRAKKAAEDLLKLRDRENEGKNKEDDNQS